MNVKSVLSSIIAICSFVNIASACGTMMFEFEPKQFKCKYIHGFLGSSLCFRDMNALASNIKHISSNNMSASSGTETQIAVVLNGVKIAENDNIGEIIFSSERGYSVILQFNDASDLCLPSIECHNIPMFKTYVNDEGSLGRFTPKHESPEGYIRSLSTDVMTVIDHNKPLQINGILCRNKMIAEPGSNNIRIMEGGF